MRIAGSGRLDKAFNPFRDEYLGEILEAIAVAWARMHHPKGQEIEDRLTFRLAGRLLNDSHFKNLPYDVVPQYWILGIDGRRLGRLDLRFKHRQSQFDYIAFEAKRLHIRYPGGSRSTEYSTYSGDEGIGAFIVGQYSKDLPVAGMLGYVMDADTAKAWEGVRTKIDATRVTLRLLLDSAFAESPLSKYVNKGMAGTRLGETSHTMESRILRIFHLLLPVLPNKRADRTTTMKMAY